MARYNREEGIELILWTYNPDDNSLITPDTTPTVQVFNPDGTEFQAPVDMVGVSTGEWAYNLSTSLSNALGKYQIKYAVSDGGVISILWDEFELGR